MPEVYVPVKPVNPNTPANSVHNAANAIRVSLSHNKYSKQVVLAAYPCERKENGITSIIVSTVEYAAVEPMPRLNRKRVELLQSAMRNELSLKTGRAWDLVQALCLKRGYTTEV